MGMIVCVYDDKDTSGIVFIPIGHAFVDLKVSDLEIWSCLNPLKIQYDTTHHTTHHHKETVNFD